FVAAAHYPNCGRETHRAKGIFEQDQALQSKLKNSSRGPRNNSHMPILCGETNGGQFMKTEEHFIHEKIAIPTAARPRSSRFRLLNLLAEHQVSANATI